jgi:hypothetical protein
MSIPRSSLCPSKALFYRIVPGKEAIPLGVIRLNVTFSQPINFHKEPLTSEIIDFPGVYHTLLGRPCFAKFMAVSNYTYLKLKMPGPKGVIIKGSFKQAYYYKQDCVTQVAVLVTPCAPDSPRRETGRAPMEEATKTAAVLSQPSIGKTVKTFGGSDGSVSPSI